jgi:hypothetical protein
MLRAIKRSPDTSFFDVDGKHKYKIKFKATVKKEEYEIESMTAYCNNCSSDFIRMTKEYFGDFSCNCGRKLEYKLLRDIESRIITDIEKNE